MTETCDIRKELGVRAYIGVGTARKIADEILARSPGQATHNVEIAIIDSRGIIGLRYYDQERLSCALRISDLSDDERNLLSHAYELLQQQILIDSLPEKVVRFPVRGRHR